MNQTGNERMDGLYEFSDIDTEIVQINRKNKPDSCDSCDFMIAIYIYACHIKLDDEAFPPQTSDLLLLLE